MSESLRPATRGSRTARWMATTAVAAVTTLSVGASPAAAADTCVLILLAVPSDFAEIAGLTDEGTSDANGDGLIRHLGRGWISTTGDCARLGLPSSGTYSRTFGDPRPATREPELIPVPSSSTGSGSSTSSPPHTKPSSSKAVRGTGQTAGGSSGPVT